MALRNWFRGAAPTPATRSSAGPSPAVSASTSTTALGSDADTDISDMEDAMAATALIMNDDIVGAEARLRRRKDSSVFHQLGLGIATFVSSILGFEKDIMAEATARLLECEAKAWSEMKKAQREGGRRGTPTTPGGPQAYPLGSEFALVHAEAELMLAIVAVLHESLTEAIKGFYKLRKAFVSLNAIMESEAASLARQQGGQAVRRSPLDEKMPGTFDDSEFAFDSDGSTGTSTPARAPVGSTTDSATSLPVLPTPAQAAAPAGGSPSSAADTGGFTNPVDIFVYSGANMCFGILLLMISMVPPAFSRLLYVIGFKGDRDRGVRMLWQSTKFQNINGGVAGLVLLAYYNGSVGYCDIVPSPADVDALAGPDEIVGYPKVRCQQLLAQMRRLYPDSMLWRLEEARALSIDRQLEAAVALLTSGDDGRMRQIRALTKFELALDSMCLMDWQQMHDTFQECIQLNDWSHAMYYYNSGCAELEQYRDAVHGDVAAQQTAARHKKAAEKYFRLAPTLAGKKKFMARQMPFDAFVIRKVAKWEERAAALGVDLADAIGTSPAQEMIYLWNGSRRMPPASLAKALTYLSWTRCTASAEIVAAMRVAPDEGGIATLCQVSLLRSLGRIGEARALLDGDLLVHDKLSFKGTTKDDYVLPAGHYEAAALFWHEACDPACYPTDARAVDAFRQQRVSECEAYLDKVVKWETFLLDARIGMKVQTGLDTIRWIKGNKKWT